MFEWIPRTLIGFLAPVGGADGVDLAGFALGQVKVLSRKVHCMSLSSIHILYNHTPAAPLRPHPELCCGLIIFHWTEVVLVWPSVAVGGAGPMEGGGGVGGRGRGSAPQQRRAWNTDSLLLPGQMPPTWL